MLLRRRRAPLVHHLPNLHLERAHLVDRLFLAATRLGLKLEARARGGLRELLEQLSVPLGHLLRVWTLRRDHRLRHFGDRSRQPLAQLLLVFDERLEVGRGGLLGSLHEPVERVSLARLDPLCAALPALQLLDRLLASGAFPEPES